MGACAIYTAIPDEGLIEDVLAGNRARASQRFGLGRLAVMALAEAFMPASHRERARALVAKHFYGAFAPALAHHDSFDDIARLVNVELTAPLWPTSAALATIIGCAPARYYGWHRRSSNGVAILDPDVVRTGIDELVAHDLSSIPDDDFLKTREVAVRLLEWLTGVRDRGDCLVVHWELG